MDSPPPPPHDYTRAGPSTLQPAYFQPAPQPQPQPQSIGSGGGAPPTPATLFRDGSAPVFRACASAMQRPTLTGVRIRSTRDAQQIFYAVARNVLPMTVRRLDAEERRAIASGNVYVWEERGANSEATGLGIERWTDGMRWSPSRVRDEFLFYHQKELDPDEAADLPPTRWARIVRPRGSGSDGSSSEATPDKIPHQRASHDPQRLIKQTYSVIVNLPDDRPRGILRKWHLTAYFTQATVDELGTVDHELPVTQVNVPEGWFRSARTGKVRRDTARQRQITFAQSYGPDVPPTSIPAGSSPTSLPSAHMSSSSAFSPQMGFSPPPAPAPFPTYRYDDDSRMQIDATPPRALPMPVYSTAYTVPLQGPQPQPQPLPSVPPHGHGRGFGAPPYPYDERAAYERERQREREQSAQDQITTLVPGAYETSPARIGISPPHPHAHPRAYGHPYANARPPPIGSRPLSHYSPPAPLPAPIQVVIPASVQPGPGPAPGPGSYPSGTAPAPASFVVPSNVMRGSAEAYRASLPPPELQRAGLLGRTRTPSTPAPAPAPVRNSASARNSPAPLPGPAALLAPRSQSATPRLGQSPAPAPLPAPGSGPGAGGEKERVLVPLDNLQNAVFPRRDPMDDALLRRFHALRTTPPASAVEQ